MGWCVDTDVLAARGGDRDGFVRPVSRYRGLVSSISLSTLRDVATSEDVAQESSCPSGDLGGLPNTAAFVPWLRSLARHRALDAARGVKKHGRAKLTTEAALETAVDPRPSAQDARLSVTPAKIVGSNLAVSPAR